MKNRELIKERRIIERTKYYLSKKKMTTKDLSNETGIEFEVIERFILGDEMPTYNTFLDIATVLDMDLFGLDLSVLKEVKPKVMDALKIFMIGYEISRGYNIITINDTKYIKLETIERILSE